MSITLEAKGVNVKLNGKLILKDITVNFTGPSLFFILGANGSGKSTLLRTLAGLIPFEGEILINGRNISDYSRKELARTVGYVWQNPLYGFFEESVEREIKFILKNLDLPLENFHDIVQFFRIQHLLHRSPFTLSGGEAKRVSISSVIVADQPIILFDEPEAEMDLHGISSIVEYIRRNVDQKLIIVATHNPLLAYKLGEIIDRIFLIKDGRIIRAISPEDIKNSELLRSIGVVPVEWWFT